MKTCIGAVINARKYGKQNPKSKTGGARRRPWSWNPRNERLLTSPLRTVYRADQN